MPAPSPAVVEAAARKDWHAEGAEAALAALGSGPGGLTAAEAAARLERHGPNRLPAARRRSLLDRLLGQFRDLLIHVLLVSAAITAVLGHVTDTLVILAVVVANAVIGFLQEGKAERAMDSLREMLSPHAEVIRDGRRQEIAAEAVVPGDILLLDPGGKPVADLRLTEAHGLRLQEAILTGESLPVDKATEPVATDAPLGDRLSMVYGGTLVAAGQGRGVVVATGADSEIGRIGGLLAGVETLTTPLVRQMAIFSRWLTFLILLVSGLLLLYGYLFGQLPFGDFFMVVVGFAVAAIPEGLPAVLTVTLAIGVRAMASRNAIVRRLPAIETIGSVSVICTDKTGTLTLNEMTVVSAATLAGDWRVTGGGYAPQGAIEGPMAVSGDAALSALRQAAAECNDAALSEAGGQWTVQGDPMEGALLAFAGKAGGCGPALPRRDAVPFDARHRYMATLHAGDGGPAVVYVKGAPERLLQLCREALRADGGTVALDAALWQRRAEQIAARGERVLALACKAVPADSRRVETESLGEGLRFLGLVGLIDPPRPEAVAAVAECRAAGIDVKMITGDHLGTAAAVGRQVGLARPEAVLSGAEIDAMEDGELAEAVWRTDVFARTSPEHKLRIVSALQARGAVVAMTGDGVNDAPALKRADAGIAMGRKGSEAAKEAAELVLTDDNFASIAAAVREGRTVYDNLKKVIAWTLPTNAGEAATIIVALLFGLTLPVTALQILWINLITAATLGLALAFEPTEENSMRRPPRRRGEPLLTGELAWHLALVSVLYLAGVFGLFSWALERGHSVELARTIAMNALVTMEIFQLFFVRNIYGTSLTWKAASGTPVVWVVIAIVAAAQFAVTYLPPLQRVFGTAAVPLWDGVAIVAVGAALFAILETEKQLRLRLRGSG